MKSKKTKLKEELDDELEEIDSMDLKSWLTVNYPGVLNEFEEDESTRQLIIHT